MDRRTFVGVTMASVAVNAFPAWMTNKRIKAVAFDGLALFDPRPIFAMTENLFPGRGAALTAA